MGALPDYLRRQPSGIYKYRRRVPDKLKGKEILGVAFPATEWVQSIGTRDPKEARDRCAALRAAHDNLIEEAEIGLASAAGLPEASKLREARIAAEAVQQASIDRRAARSGLRIANRQLMQISTATLPPDVAAWLDIVKEERGVGAEAYTAATVVVMNEAERVGGKTLGAAIAAYTDQRVSIKRGSTQKSNATAFAFLLAAMGQAKRLPSITRDDARKALTLLHRQPCAQWAGKGIAPHQRASLAERESLPLLSHKTIMNSYLSFWVALFRYAKREDWIENNVFEGLTAEVAGRKTVKRGPFTETELATLFSSAPWNSVEQAASVKPIRYWGPLIALYHGLRRGEIAQLRANLFTEDKGVIVFEVAGDTKTENAMRKLALHPELIRLGLPALAQQRAAHGLLFEGEASDKRGVWGDAFGDWFSAHRKQLGIGKNGQGLHAFRHNFEDALRDAELHQTAIGQYLGGRKAVDPVGGNYGSGHSAQRLFEAISKVRYASLFLSK